MYLLRDQILFWGSFVALSADHSFNKQFLKDPKFIKFKEDCNKTGTTEEAIANAEKIGFNTGQFVEHPFLNGKKLPIYLQILY